MKPIDFLKNYNPINLSRINSVRIINNIENNSFNKILLNGNVKLNAHFSIWSQEYFLNQINNIGMMYSEIVIHEANRNCFKSLDEFMYYTRFKEDDNLRKDHFLKYPFKKEDMLSKNDFKENLHLYCDDIFMQNENSDLIDLNYDNYIEGYFYFHEPSVIVLGCTFVDRYMNFSYYPYI